MLRSSEPGTPRFARTMLVTGGLAALSVCALRLLTIQGGAQLQRSFGEAAAAERGESKWEIGARVRRVTGPRGDILDRYGQPLACSSLVYDVELELQANGAMPPRLAEDLIQALELAGPLSHTRREAIRRYVEFPSRGARHDLWAKLPKDERHGYQWLWTRPIAHDLSDARVLRRLHELKNDRYYWREIDDDGQESKRRAGLFRLRFQESWRRAYPLGPAAAHVVGIEPGEREILDKKGRKITVNPQYGLETIKLLGERSTLELDERFTGRGAGIVRGQDVAPLVAEMPRAQIRTTIDAELQDFAYMRLRNMALASGARHGLFFLADLQTGDLLALTGWPSHDVTNPDFGKGGEKSSLFPVTHQARFEPGSVIKPLLVAQALHMGVVHFASEIDCRGNISPKKFRIRGRRTITDDHAVSRVNLARVLIESSNIGAVKIGMMGGVALHQQMNQVLGLSENPRIGLPPAMIGKDQPLPASFPQGYYWTAGQYDVYTGPSLSHGYQLNIYPLAFGQAFATAITGRKFRFRLLRGFAAPGEELQPFPKAGPGERVYDDAQCQWLRETLAQVVTDEHGTGRHICDERVAGWLGGKTGTSFRKDKKTGKRNYRASFVGFAPIQRPRYVALCVIEKDGGSKFYGGRFAAPVVKDILLYLRDREGRSRAVSSVR
jgi:cell division protein FtsI (penicillin-binding protein 3)